MRSFSVPSQAWILVQLLFLPATAEKHHSPSQVAIGGFSTPKILSSTAEIAERFVIHRQIFYYEIKDSNTTVTSPDKRGKETRRLAGSETSIQPTFDPLPGSYKTAVGVALLVGSSPSSFVRFTFNMTATDVMWRTVRAGYIVHLQESSTLYAYTLNDTGAGDSPIVQGYYDVPSYQYGRAYFVPYHNQKQGFSGR